MKVTVRLSFNVIIANERHADLLSFPIHSICHLDVPVHHCNGNSFHETTYTDLILCPSLQGGLINISAFCAIKI